jgi:elongation factor P
MRAFAGLRSSVSTIGSASLCRSSVRSFTSLRGSLYALRDPRAVRNNAFAQTGMAPPQHLLLGGVRHNTTQIAANEMREGDLLEMDKGLWRVMKREFSRTAMGRAYIQAEVRHMTEGTKRDLRFRSEDLVDKASMDASQVMSVLYMSGESTIACMNASTFEQIEIPGEELLGEKMQYIAEGLTLQVESYKGVPAIVTLPARVSAVVLEMTADTTATVVAVPPLDNGGGGGGSGGAAPVTDTSTATRTFKVRVPKFIKVGDRLSIDTGDGKYLSREG